MVIVLGLSLRGTSAETTLLETTLSRTPDSNQGREPSTMNSRRHGLSRNPKGPNLEKIQDRLKFSISLENFNPDLQNSPQKNRGLVDGSLEIFKLA